MEHSQRELNQDTDTWVVGYGWIFAGEKNYPIQIFFPATPILLSATKDFRFPNTMSSLAYSKGKLRFSCSLSGSPSSSGKWQFSVASSIEVKSNISTQWSMKLSTGIEGISTLKIITFKVVTFTRQISAASKSTNGWPTLSIITCLISNRWYHKDFPWTIQWMQSLYSLQKQSNELQHFWKILLGWTGSVLQEWWKPKVELPTSCTPRECFQSCPFVSFHNHPRE